MLKKLNFSAISSPILHCAECGLPMYVLTKNHMETEHGMTKEEYIRKHPEQSDIGYWGTLYYSSPIRKVHDAVVRRALG